MNNNTKARFNQLSKTDRQRLAEAGKVRLSKRAKVGAPNRKQQ